MHHSECCLHPRSAKEEEALKELQDMIIEHENMHPDPVVVILGGFNHCNLKKDMPKVNWFVTFLSRENKILEHCYSNIRNTFSVGTKDHQANNKEL